VCVCVCARGWLRVGKIKSLYLHACFILVSFLVFLLCPGRCVQFAVCYTSASNCLRSVSYILLSAEKPDDGQLRPKHVVSITF
jgi:hypothetical protein